MVNKKLWEKCFGRFIESSSFDNSGIKVLKSYVEFLQDRVIKAEGEPVKLLIKKIEDLDITIESIRGQIEGGRVSVIESLNLKKFQVKKFREKEIYENLLRELKGE